MTSFPVSADVDGSNSDDSDSDDAPAGDVSGKDVAVDSVNGFVALQAA